MLTLNLYIENSIDLTFQEFCEEISKQVNKVVWFKCNWAINSKEGDQVQINILKPTK